MEDTSGFYSFDIKCNELLYAPNGVISLHFNLEKEFKDNYIYPIENWYWFDSVEEANLFFNITKG